MTRRRFLELSGLGLAGVGVLAYSGGYEPQHLEIAERTITLQRLPPEMDGLRIAQISDIHYKEYTEPSFVREVVAQVNRLKPDLVLMTGDYVSKGPLPLSRARANSYLCAQTLAQIECPQRWCVLGNHDAAVGAAVVIDALQSHGLPVLENRHVPFEHQGARIWIAGVQDVGMRHPDLHLAAPRGLQSAREPVILMVHEPDYANHVVRHGGVDLVVSGHTHGGQVRLPLVGALYLPPLGRKYPEGHFHLENGVQLYVNRGVGVVGVPFRFDCRPELTMFTLRSTQAA